MADIFVFPSNFEGLGVALVEAMFKSLPCIASRIEVFQEFINDGETGLLIDQTSPIELRNAMVERLCDSVLSIPIHTEMDSETQNYIIESVKDFFTAKTQTAK